jgi:TPR repeat protein
MRYPRIIHAFIAVALMALLPEGARAQTGVQELTQECDAKNGRSCVLLGFRYRDGEGVPKDPVKAGALQEKACNAGYGAGCMSLAFLWEDGAPGDDVAKVIRLRIRGCELKEGSSCRHLGQMYLTGEGVTKDVARAIKLFEQACDELEDGDRCMELHFMLEKGDVIPRDKKRSDAYYERGCDLEAFLCVMAFDGYLNPLEDSCEKGGLASCLEVGHMHLSGEAYLKVDEAEASKYFQKARDGNLADACPTLGWVFDYSKQTPRNPAKAVANYQTACTGKYASGGTNNGKRVLNAMSGDFSDIWPAVMNVGYTFDGEDASARLIGVMIVTHANTNAEFDMRDAVGAQRGHLVRARVLRAQNFALNCTPKICGSFRKPVRLLKSMPPVATSSSVMLRPKSAASYFPPFQL